MQCLVSLADPEDHVMRKKSTIEGGAFLRRESLFFGLFEAMKCFQFSNGEKKEAKTMKSTSNRSYASELTEREMRRSGSEFSSQNVSDLSTESLGRAMYPNLSQRQINLRVFTFRELKAATRNFSRSLMLGEGGFGCVYRGAIRSSEDPSSKLEIAVKKLNTKGIQGHKEWVTEVNFLGVVEHPNLVKSVEDHLSTRFSEPLSWSMRLKVAEDAARGLTYLHEEMDFQIIFRDLKTSNILLDEHWNAKLSDFGLARLGPAEGLSHVSTAAVGTFGYAAPEYMQSGRLTAKCDVWSYGVVLYELITGRHPWDRNRPKSEQKLLDWVKPYLQDEKKFPLIVDPRLEGQYSLKSVQKLSAIANRCLVRHPKSRPKMSEVREMVKNLVEMSETGSPQPPVRSSDLEEPKKKAAKLNRGFGDWRIGDGRQSLWRAWRPKLIRTC
ncbi:hypothetical protein MRB53_034693 [Persea americana]|uniref:Uncharacterized protein n=1 Tax=Persea americana TaxID=3435 RepID=A0ACC2K2M3_PERAE|nr:hypothetical protein MRB53_034693 [Persea americana]